MESINTSLLIKLHNTNIEHLSNRSSRTGNIMLSVVVGIGVGKLKEVKIGIKAKITSLLN